MANLTAASKVNAAAFGILVAFVVGSPAPAQSVDTNRLALARQLVRYKYADAMEQTSQSRSGLEGAPTNLTIIIDEELRGYCEKVARAAAMELTATELKQMLHLEQSETMTHLRNRWKAIRPRLEDFSVELIDTTADRFAEWFADTVIARGELKHPGCKLCDAKRRGPLDTWAIHWLEGRPVSHTTGTQPELHPLYYGLTSTNAEAAQSDTYLQTMHQDTATGDEDSALTLGCLYWLAEDFDTATNWLTRAAHRDSHGAQFMLGHALYAGWGVSRDAESALSFLRAAAAQDVAQAQYKLGEVYLEPNGEFSDKQKGLQWMKRAADNGLPRANLVLGNYLLTEAPTPARRTLAEKYLHRAATAGLQEAYKDLVAYHMTWGNSDQAVRWLKKLINRGDLSAYHTLAVKYQNTGKSAEAFRWWSTGAERGHRKSQLETARLHASGRGCERDVVAAEKWLIVAGADEQERQRAYEGTERPTPGQVEEAEKLAEAYLNVSGGGATAGDR